MRFALTWLTFICAYTDARSEMLMVRHLIQEEKGMTLLLRMTVKSCCCGTQVLRILRSVIQNAQRADARLLIDPKSKQRQAWGGGESRANETLRMCLMVSTARASF